MPFSYFGSKAKLIKYYQPPKYDLIIEPFAGAANYSYTYYDRDVWLNDSWEPVYKIWLWIQQASKTDILQLPEPKFGEKISDIKNLCDGERLLLTLLCTRAGGRLGNDTVSKWSAGLRKKPRPGDWKTKDHSVFRLTKIKLLKIAGKINHWKITNLDYSKIKNQQATWFIDPPYQFKGTAYADHNKKLDFEKLGKWCLSRKGEIIVCEASPANWLPFVPLRHKKLQVSSAKSTYQEVVYLRCDKKVGLEQLL